MAKPIILSQINTNTQLLSHKNLLDNAWFIVNTRNKTSYSNEYGLDRWKCWNINTNANGISVTNGASMQQTIDLTLLQDVVGNTLTFSIMYNNTIESVSYTNFVVSSTAYEFNTTAAKFTIQNNILTITFKLATIIRAVKLELGQFETLHLDSIPRYEDETRICYQSIADANDSYTHYSINNNINNYNILHNSYFLINDRQSTTANNSYAVNRWYGKYSYNQGINLTTGYIQQVLDKATSDTIKNKLLTLSINGSTNIVFTFMATTTTSHVIYNINNTTIEFNYVNSQFTLKISSNSLSLTHIKLEYGIVSTITNDVCNTLDFDRLMCNISTADSNDDYSNYKSSTTPRFIRFVLIANNWNDGVYTFDSSLDRYNIEISLDPNAAANEAVQYAEAMFTGSPDSNIIKCFGKTPSINLHVFLKLEAR